MNKKLLRSVPIILLLINAVVMVLPAMNVSQMITAAAILGGLCYFVFTKPTDGITRKFYWYAMAAMLLGVMVPGYGSGANSIGDALGRFFRLGAKSQDTVVMIVCFGFLVVSQIWMKPKRFAWGMIIARYAALYIAMFTVGKYMIGNSTVFRPLLMAAVALSAAGELFGEMMGEPKPATLRCFLFLVIYLLLSQLYFFVPELVYDILTENWLSALAVLVLAGLVLAENYETYGKKSSHQMMTHNSVAWAMIAWVAFRMLTVAFPVLFNAFVVYLCFPMAFALTVLCANKLSRQTWNRIFIIAGSTLFAVLLALARTQMLTLAAYALLVLVFGAAICVCIAAKKALSAAARNTLMGIAGVILLTVQRFSLTDTPAKMGLKIFVAIALCVLWGSLCHRTEQLQIKASATYKEEFKSLRPFGWCVPLALLVIALISVLFNI